MDNKIIEHLNDPNTEIEMEIAGEWRQQSRRQLAGFVKIIDSYQDGCKRTIYHVKNKYGVGEYVRVARQPLRLTSGTTQQYVIPSQTPVPKSRLLEKFNVKIREILLDICVAECYNMVGEING